MQGPVRAKRSGEYPTVLNVNKPEDLKKLERLLNEIQQDRSENLKDDLPELSPLELRLEQVRLKEDGRKRAGELRRKKNHQKRMKRAENQRGTYRRKLRRWETAWDGNWYPIVRRRWVQKGLNVQISEANWNKHVAPHLPLDDVITVRRYNYKDKTISLGRIYVTAEDDKSKVYFDGAEWSLKNKGYVQS